MEVHPPTYLLLGRLAKCGPVVWEETKANGLPARRCAQYPDLLMLPTDHALASDAAFKGHTARFASSLPTFHAEFAAAFQKLQENGHPDLVEVG